MQGADASSEISIGPTPLGRGRRVVMLRRLVCRPRSAGLFHPNRPRVQSPPGADRTNAGRHNGLQPCSVLLLFDRQLIGRIRCTE